METASSAHLPAPPALSDLLASGRVAVFCDFDGTIVPIADNPNAIVVAPDLGTRLAALAERLGGALAVVSGRSIEDLQRFLGPAAIHWAGSHGADVRMAAGGTLSSPRALPDTVVEALRAFADGEGLYHEAKAHGATLHYRSRPELEDHAHRIAAELAATHGLAIKPGKCVVELVWPGADKGSAVEALVIREPFAGAMPVFVGDDITDEDGFAACERLGGFGIAVGERPSAGARYRLGLVSEVHAWLDL